MKEYIIKTKSGYYVGLFNWGRVYRCAIHKCIIKETPERARNIAAAFDGELIEVRKH